MTPVRWVLLLTLAIFMTGAGLYHFVNRDAYEALIPPILPARRFLVYVSGVMEIGFGLALLVPAWRPRAAIGVIVTLIVIFPANIWMALGWHRRPPRPRLLCEPGRRLDKTPLPRTLHLVGVPVRQGLVTLDRNRETA